MTAPGTYRTLRTLGAGSTRRAFKRAARTVESGETYSKAKVTYSTTKRGTSELYYSEHAASGATGGKAGGQRRPQLQQIWNCDRNAETPWRLSLVAWAALVPATVAVCAGGTLAEGDDTKEVRMADVTSQNGASAMDSKVNMDPNVQENVAIEGGEITYEMFVKMSCEGCAKSVRKALEKNSWEVVKIDVPAELVVVRAPASAKEVLAAVETTGKEARIIGSSAADEATLIVPENVGSYEESVSVIGEFRGQDFGHGPVLGVVRIIQLTNTTAALQLSLGKLEPGKSYSIAIHSYGDIRPGRQGGVFQGSALSSAEAPTTRDAAKGTIGFLYSGIADSKGNLEMNKAVYGLQVWEAIGRGMVVHADDEDWTPLAACVVARSAVVGSNHKKVCTCDGTVIWEAY